MKTNLRIVIIAVICLVLGVTVGFFTAGRLTKKRIHEKVELNKPPRFKQRLEEKLELTPAQQETFNTVFKEHMLRMREIDRTTFQKRSSEIDSLFNQLKEGLNEKQVKKLERFGKRLKDRKRRPKPPHPAQHMK